ncbi:hypothetical protein NIES2119_08065 [[Phormidium ambiguum] IAM M-71]|uniref:Uncharacterized protein n=1 Tax=[Phormidium ambiguum] IAM M-71 TaxID=454136 RepID=A0A1U7IP55_9CYAN|nr:hypothetical protein [Phormidium ambiguum]OKH39075.1 hypothetical protein NIES2119_08065 [Phormidium ambiguum IAM M-71]
MFEQSIEDYIETYNNYKDALEEVKNSIVDQAFQSGGDLKDWLDSFGFGRNNMMFPIPAISETECEICVTFYYLPQIKMKEQNTVPRPFPLPATNPINITWQNGLPKIETNWEFDLIPHPPVKICVRKDKPECKRTAPTGCITLEDYEKLKKDFEDGVYTEDNLPPEINLPICRPPFNFPDAPPEEPGVEQRFDVEGWAIRKAIGFAGVRREYPWAAWQSYPGGTQEDAYQTRFVSWYNLTREEYISGECRYPRWSTNFNWRVNFEGNFPPPKVVTVIGYHDVWPGLIHIGGYCQGYFNVEPRVWMNGSRIFPNGEGGGGTPATEPPINQENQMSCCEESLRILRRIDRNLTQLMKWSGAATGGFEVPEHLHDRSPGDDWLGNAWDAITPDKTLRLRSMPEFYKWQLEKLQEFFGTFPIVFEDDQDNPIAFPTIGNALQAIAMKQVAQEKVLGVIQKGVIKNILETGSTREQTVLITSLLNCLVDYFEMRLEDDTVTLNHNFQAIQIQNMSLVQRDEQDMWLEFLDNQDFQAKISKFNPNATTNGQRTETFSDTAKRILAILDILKAAHTIPINQQMPEINVRQYLGELRKFYKGLTLDDRDLTKDDSSDLSQWMNKVEGQFGSEVNPPINSTTTPWGQTINERPKIIIKGEGAPQDSDA